MPHLTFQGSPDGPLIDVHIGLSHPRRDLLRQHQQPVPAALPALFLVDTGASHCLVDADFVRSLNIPERVPSGGLRTATHSPNSQHNRKVRECDVSLEIWSPASAGIIWTIPAVAITTIDQKPFGTERYVGVLGRDVLDRGMLVYSGVGKPALLAW